jgi:hypothetical protein
MNAIEMYRSLIRGAHDFLEGTLADVTAEDFGADPPGAAFSIGTNYAHVLTSEDFGVHTLLQDKPTLAASTWSGKLGLAELPPFGPGGDLKTWSRKATIDREALKRYGQAVYAATDAYLASLTPDALDRKLDLSRFGFGQRPTLFVLTALLANASLHTGEISCLKGLQGRKGYPV